MKQRAFVLLLILTVLPLVVLPLLADQPESWVYGRMKIPARRISAEVYHQAHENCDCCDPLFGGGEVRVEADLSSVEVGDIAYITSLEGDYKVLECVEITEYIRIGRWLINWHGIIRSYGDILVTQDGTVYKWAIL